MKYFILQTDNEIPEISIGISTPSEDLMGTSHVVEHLIMGQPSETGTVFYQDIYKRYGVYMTASTGLDRTVFSLTCKKYKNLIKVFDYVLNSILYPIFSQKTFNQEVYQIRKNVIHPGAAMKEMIYEWSREERKEEYRVLRTFFNDGPYSYPRGGLPEWMATITLTDIQEYHLKYYSEEKIKIIIKLPRMRQEDLDVLKSSLEKRYYPRTTLLTDGSFSIQCILEKKYLLKRNLPEVFAGLCRFEKPTKYDIDLIFSKWIKRRLLDFEYQYPFPMSWKCSINSIPYTIIGLGVRKGKKEKMEEKEYIESGFSYITKCMKDVSPGFFLLGEVSTQYSNSNLMAAWLRGCHPKDYIMESSEEEASDFLKISTAVIQSNISFSTLHAEYENILEQHPITFMNLEMKTTKKNIQLATNPFLKRPFCNADCLLKAENQFDGFLKAVKQGGLSTNSLITLYVEFLIDTEANAIALHFIKQNFSYLSLYTKEVEVFSTRFHGEHCGLRLSYDYTSSQETVQKILQDMKTLRTNINILVNNIITKGGRKFIYRNSPIDNLIDKCAGALCCYGRFMGIDSERNLVLKMQESTKEMQQKNDSMPFFFGATISDYCDSQKIADTHKWFTICNHTNLILPLLPSSQRYGDLKTMGQVVVGYSWKKGNRNEAAWLILSEVFSKQTMTIMTRNRGHAYDSFSIFNLLERICFFCIKDDLTPEKSVKRFKALQLLTFDAFNINDKSLQEIIIAIKRKISSNEIDWKGFEVSGYIKATQINLGQKNLQEALDKISSIEEIVNIATASIEKISDVIVGLHDSKLLEHTIVPNM